MTSHLLARSLFASVTTTLLLGAGCDVLFGTYCDENADCPSDAPICASSGLCVAGGQDGGPPEPDPQPDDGGRLEPDPQPGDGGSGLLRIDAIDGTGSVQPPTDPAPVSGDVVAATRRLEDRLVVTGAGLSAVEDARLSSDDETTTFDLSIAEDASDGELVLNLPNNVTAGLFTLTLVAASSEAAAQVYLLQGEAGPPPSVTQAPASAQQCPHGGTVVNIGDDDPIVLCNGLGSDCAGSNCTLDGNLNVTGSLAVADVPVARQIEGNETRQVADADALVAELIALSAFRISPNAVVTLQVAPGTHTLNAPFFFGHPDSAQIRVIGDLGEPTSVTIECAARCVSLSRRSQGGFIDGIRFLAAAGNEETGIVVAEASSLSLGGDVIIEGFGTGIELSGASTVFSEPGLTITNGGNFSTAVVVNGLSSAILPGVMVSSYSRGVEVRQGHVELVDGILDGIGPTASTGLFVRNNGTAFAPNISIANFDRGISVSTSAFVVAPLAEVSAVNIGIDANKNGLASISGATFRSVALTAVEAQTNGIVVAPSLIFDQVANETDIGTDALFLLE